MKYLIVQEDEGMEFPVFCAGVKTHEEMATAWRRSPRVRVLSAGFVEIGQNGVTTFGSSYGLNLKPRPQDARIIAVFIEFTLKEGRQRESFLPPVNANFAAFPTS